MKKEFIIRFSLLEACLDTDTEEEISAHDLILCDPQPPRADMEQTFEKFVSQMVASLAAFLETRKSVN